MAVETEEYLAMMRRMIRAAGRRVADADELELRDLLSLQAELDQAILVAVAGQRRMNRSWAFIAEAAGSTRQAAQARWGKRVDDMNREEENR